MLSDFFAALLGDKKFNVDEIAIEIADISEICAESKAASLKKIYYSQDQITESMIRTFSKEFSIVGSVELGKKLYKLTYHWVCNETLPPEKQYQIAAVQRFVLWGIREQIQTLEIKNLIRICDDYNDALCHDHALALQKVSGNKELSEIAGNAVFVRASAFIAMRNALHSEEKTFEEKLKGFVHLAKDFHEAMQEYPMEEATTGRFAKFTRSLHWLSCVVQNVSRQDNKSYFQFTDTINKVIGEHIKSFEHPECYENNRV